MHIYTYVYAYYYYFSDIIPISFHFTISFGLLKTTWTWLNNVFIAWLVFCLHFISNHFIFSCFFLLIWCVFFSLASLNCTYASNVYEVNLSIEYQTNRFATRSNTFWHEPCCVFVCMCACFSKQHISAIPIGIRAAVL